MTRKQSSYPAQPPRDRGTVRAFLLAVLMHVLLGFFLYHGIHWQNSTPAGAEAELWTEVPDVSTPRPVAPPAPVAPAPPQPTEEADIALQQQKHKQEEAARQAQLAEQQRLQLQQQQEAAAKRQQQLAAQQAAQLAAQQKAAKLKQQQEQQAAAAKLKQQQLDAQKKQQQEDEQKQAQLEAQKKADAAKAAKAKAQADAQATKKLDAERNARIAQMQGLAGGSENAGGNGLAKSGTGSGAGGTAASSGYAEKVQRLVRPKIIWAGATEGLETVVTVRCAATGTLLSASVSRSSGNQQWDAAALRAVQQSDPMPLDKDGKAPSNFTITLRPAG
ncbi:cell envelope integrity protein TolA [Paraburkholderia adhaesiva]|uniref:cell envelope integrity protein TolA n=1 Tax=Paraburkholderia adhaesiva TaxID=2883244 RepID=UPI001F1C2A72|nr:cell envelope integrity protein TolA [Paraburkholderia adhaesiva]